MSGTEVLLNNNAVAQGIVVLDNNGTNAFGNQSDSLGLTDLQLRASPVATSIATTQRLASAFRKTDASQISAGKKSVSFANSGTANATITSANTVLKPGEIINFVAPSNDTLAAIQYVATGTELLIAVVE